MKTESLQSARVGVGPVPNAGVYRIALALAEAAVYIAVLWEILARLPPGEWLPAGAVAALFAACEHSAVRTRLPLWEKAGIVAAILIVAVIFTAVAGLFY